MSVERSPQLVFDHTDFFEFFDNDSCGIYQSEPTARDFITNGPRLAKAIEFNEAENGWNDKLRQCIYAVDAMRREIAPWPYKITNCPTCDFPTEHSLNRYRENSSHNACRLCGWWYADYHILAPKSASSFERSYQVCQYAVLKQFTVGNLDIPLGTLRAHIANDPSCLHGVHPRKLEELVADIFSDFLDCDVAHVGKSGDGGIDVIVLDCDNPKVIQVKRRSRSNAVEGVREIREFLGAMVLQDYSRGMFVSTGRSFSEEAKRAAKEAKKIGAVECLELVDCRKLVEILRLTDTKNRPPWMEHVVPLDAQPGDFELVSTVARECFSALPEIASGGENSQAWVCNPINEK
jgi:restriction system protein